MALKFAVIDEQAGDLAGIVLPIGNKNYLIVPPDARTGMGVVRLLDGNQMDDAEVEAVLGVTRDDLLARILGPALPEMLADGVSWVMVEFAFRTALIWIQSGAVSAAQHWATGNGGAAMVDADLPVDATAPDPEG